MDAHHFVIIAGTIVALAIRMIESIHTDTEGTVQFNHGSTSTTTVPQSHSKSVAASNKAATLLQRLFCSAASSSDTVSTQTCLRHIRNVLFADDAAVVTHIQEELQSLTLVDFGHQDNIDKRIGKAASTLARLAVRVWTSPSCR